MEMEKKNIFVDFAHSLYNFKAYPRLMNNKGFKVFVHGFLLSLLAIIPMIVSFVSFSGKVGSIDDIIDKYVPDFSIEDGVLSISQPYLFVDNESNEYFIYIDTSKSFSFDDLYTYYEQYNSVLLADSEKMYIVSANNNNGMQSLTFKDLNEISSKIDRDSLKELAGYITPIVIVIGIIIYIFMLIGVYFFALIKTIFTAIIAAIMKVNLSYGKVYKLTLYSTTIVYVIACINGLLPFNIPFYGLIKFAVFCIYVVMAIKAFKAEEFVNSLSINNGNGFNPQLQNMPYQNGYNQGNVMCGQNGYNQGNVMGRQNGYNQGNVMGGQNGYNQGNVMGGQNGYNQGNAMGGQNGYNQAYNMPNQPNGFNNPVNNPNYPQNFYQQPNENMDNYEQQVDNQPRKTYAELNEELAQGQYNNYSREEEQDNY